MGLIEAIIIIVVIGVVLFLIKKYIPMDPSIRNILTIFVIVVVVLLVLYWTGILPRLHDITIPRVR